jgi:serine/threonine protein kinase
MSIDFNRLEQILAEASTKKDAAHRSAFLDEACGQDRELRTEVERLLAASQKAGDFLEMPVQAAAITVRRAECGMDSSEQATGGFEGPGSMINRYKLLEEIGEGGFGLVYMAEQVEPIQRKVALKIVKAGMDTREVIARFEAERQALALMDHPSIARVFDGGVTQGGRPYFVMELVHGIPITEFCDQRKLSTPERLKLFIQVCHAIQHAHQKGVIHRDLKPTNILVTLIDGEPVPKVIDFGVAKALGQKLTKKTLFTGFLKMVGTPAYMSPEQADFSGTDVDTRVDIYSLGVLLYELLTGVTPFDAETLHNATLDEVRRMIRETEPPKPSTRLRTMGEKLTTVAQQRQAEPAILTRLVHGDLDWIVMRCLEKDRRRRYETANSLAGDIERHLGHEPVLACPPSTSYRFRKFAARNKTTLVAASLISLALLLGSVISILQTIRATKAQRLAAQRLEADVSELLLKALDSATRPPPKGANYTVEQLLDDFCAGLGDRLSQEPEVEASAHSTVGNAYRWLDATDKGQLHLETALALRRRLLGSRHAKVAESMIDLAWNHHERKDNHTAETLARAALAICKEKNLPHQAVQASECLQAALKDLGRFEETERVAYEALLLTNSIGSAEGTASPCWPKPSSPDSAAWLELARLCFDAEERALATDDVAKIQQLFTEAARRGGVDDPLRLQTCEWRRRGYSSVGSGQWKTAINALSKAIELQPHLPELYFERGYSYFQLAQFPQALPDFTRALQRGPRDPGTWAVRGLVNVKLGQPEEALADYSKAIECWRARIHSVNRGEYAGVKGRPCFWSFATSVELMHAGADPFEVRALCQELEAVFRDEIAALKKQFGPSHAEVASALNDLAQFLQAQGKFEDAEACLRERAVISLSGTNESSHGAVPR